MHGTEKVKVIRICFKDSGAFKDRTYSYFLYDCSADLLISATCSQSRYEIAKPVHQVKDLATFFIWDYIESHVIASLLQ